MNARRKKRAAAALVLALLMTMLSGCAGSAAVPKPSEAPVAVEPAGPAEPAEAAETQPAAPVRQDGERFEDIIILEGMEETVQYEHVRSDRLGFEMDYDYENFVRRSEGDRECFVSNYDDPENPEYYLEVTCNPQDAETVAAAIGAVLSLDYEIGRTDTFQLERAGGCIRIDASEGKGHTGTPDQLQMVYIIPADDGCRVAVAHYAWESAEGFGRRFHYMMDSFSILAAQGEKRISEEQALSAVKRYCLLSNPELEGVVKAGEYPVYWELAPGDGQEIVVLFRSYTGALIRYYIDPASGETYVTEFVPGVSSEETRTEERFNAWEYVF